MLFLLLALMAHSSAATCLNYDTDIVVIGTLSEQTFQESLNDQGSEKGDVPATYFFLKPDSTLCLLASARGEAPAAQVDSMQLVFPAYAAKSDKAPRLLLGEDVECAGKLIPASSSHNHTPILLADAVCHVR